MAKFERVEDEWTVVPGGYIKNNKIKIWDFDELGHLSLIPYICINGKWEKDDGQV